MSKIKLVLEVEGEEINSLNITGEVSMLEKAFYDMSDTLTSAARPKNSNNTLDSSSTETAVIKDCRKPYLPPTGNPCVSISSPSVTNKPFTGVSTATVTYDRSVSTSNAPIAKYNSTQSSSALDTNNIINTTQSPVQSQRKRVLYKGKRALTAFKCPKCNGSTIMMGEIGDKATCRVCGHASNIPDELVLTVSQCPNCSCKSILYSSDDIDMMHCKDCDSPIDLQYVEKLGQKISL